MIDPLVPVLSIFFFVIGACLGSFANVMIVRMPAGESIAFPGSHCRACKAKINWYHNIPIIAWLILRGRCAKCGARFSARYAIVELVMAVLFCLTFFATGLNVTLGERLIFVFMAVTASVIDLDHMILPDKFTLTGIVLGLLGALVNPERTFVDAALGVLMGGGFLWAVAYLYWVFRHREGMGGGDIKLLAWIGSLLGWSAIPAIIIVSSIVGSLFGLVLATRSKAGLRFAIPFGPYLVAATLAYMLLGGQSWSRWYLSMHGLAGG